MPFYNQLLRGEHSPPFSTKGSRRYWETVLNINASRISYPSSLGLRTTQTQNEDLTGRHRVCSNGEYHRQEQPRSHQNRPYSCNRCHLNFKAKGHLAQHLRIVHDKQRPFQCHRCGKSFGRRFDLKSHQDAVHLNVRKHKCMKCDRAFAKRSNLIRHALTLHTEPDAWRSSGNRR